MNAETVVDMLQQLLKKKRSGANRVPIFGFVLLLGLLSD
jgi:hypothetical protein